MIPRTVLAWWLLGLLVIASIPLQIRGLNRQPPAVVRTLQPAAAPPATDERQLLWVILDGVRSDALARMPRLRAAARQGVLLQLEVGLPSFSRPNYVTLATGAPPSHTGVRTNHWTGAAPFDSIFARFCTDGRRCTAIMEKIDWWHVLYAPELASRGVRAEPRALLPAIKAALREDQLVLVHFTAVDHASHQHGARSPEVDRQVELLDALVGTLLEQVDPRRWTLLFQSDHGHRDQGGHGGDEPEVRFAPAVFLGQGIRPAGEQLAQPWPGRAIDVAPTLAALLGVAPPAQAEGRILTELLELPPAELRLAHQRLEQSQQQLWQAWLASREAAPRTRVTSGTPPRASQTSAQLRAEFERGEAAALLRTRLGGLLLAGLLWAPLAWWIGRRPWPGATRGQRWSWSGLGWLLPLLAALLYWASGGGFTFSDVRLRLPWMVWVTLVAVAALLPVGGRLWLAARRSPPPDRPAVVVAAGWRVITAVVLVHLLGLAWSASGPGMQLADPVALYLPLLTGSLLAITLLGLGGMALPGWWAARSATRRPPASPAGQATP